MINQNAVSVNETTSLPQFEPLYLSRQKQGENNFTATSYHPFASKMHNQNTSKAFSQVI